jgi:hypothetical protein
LRGSLSSSSFAASADEREIELARQEALQARQEAEWARQQADDLGERLAIEADLKELDMGDLREAMQSKRMAIEAFLDKHQQLSIRSSHSNAPTSYEAGHHDETTRRGGAS